MKRKKTDIVQLSKIRMREELRQKLAKDAERQVKSLNAVIVERIEQAYEEDQREEATAKWLQESNEAAEEEHRQFWEERAKQDAEDEAAFRDSKILRSLIGGDENAELLRLFVLGLGNNPNWASTAESRRVLADKIHNFLLTHDFSEKGDEE